MARKRNPARLVIALSVAAVLAVFLLYTSIAGGGTASVSPSELDGKTGVVTLVGKVEPGYKGDPYGAGLRFRLRDLNGGAPERSPSSTRGRCRTSSVTDREVSSRASSATASSSRGRTRS